MVSSINCTDDIQSNKIIGEVKQFRMNVVVGIVQLAVAPAAKTEARAAVAAT
jgi:hypothetical protein